MVYVYHYWRFRVCSTLEKAQREIAQIHEEQTGSVIPLAWEKLPDFEIWSAGRWRIEGVDIDDDSDL